MSVCACALQEVAKWTTPSFSADLCSCSCAKPLPAARIKTKTPMTRAHDIPISSVSLQKIVAPIGMDGRCSKGGEDHFQCGREFAVTVSDLRSFFVFVSHRTK